MENQRYHRLNASHLEEIRESVDWQALFTGLGLRKCERKSKPDDWWAYSPFHDETEASFHMGPGAVWYDFSIGRGGGVLELVQSLRRCNCYQAGQWLLKQGWATCSVVRRQADQTRRKAAQATEVPPAENPTIRQDLMPLTFYHEYLAERGLSQDVCEELGIGFLSQGRSPLRGRVIFQLCDARPDPKADRQMRPVILSHLGRAIDEQRAPKYLYYDGFQKSLELLGQDRCWLHEPTCSQIRETGFLLLTEGPFDWAKAVAAGLLNTVACLGAQLSPEQATKLKAICESHEVSKVLVAFDRDKTGYEATAAACELLSAVGLQTQVFDWNAPVAIQQGKPVQFPSSIGDVADFSCEQLGWLRVKGRL